jgi:hypothetical protein
MSELMTLAEALKNKKENDLLQWKESPYIYMDNMGYPVCLETNRVFTLQTHHITEAGWKVIRKVMTKEEWCKQYINRSKTLDHVTVAENSFKAGEKYQWENHKELRTIVSTVPLPRGKLDRALKNLKPPTSK